MLIAFVLMIGAGFRTAIRAERPFEKLLATGLTTILGVQAFIIIAGVIRVLPLTGVTLPFVSYGGSSLVANYVLLALLMRISDSTARRLGEIPEEVTLAGTPSRQAVRQGERRRPGADATVIAGPGRGRVNKQIRRLAVGLLLCYVVLFVQLNVLQVGKDRELRADPRNTREAVKEFNKPRGQIVSADGVVLAESVPSDDGFDYQRSTRPGDLFANVTGYYSFAFGATQLEKTQNDMLNGTTPPAARRAPRHLQRQERQQRRGPAHDARRPAAAGQGSARRARGLGRDARPAHRRRARDVQLPELRPERRRRPRHHEAGDVARRSSTRQPDKPLLANAYQERYMPGSTFKVVTTTIALENGVVTPDDACSPTERSYTAAPDHRPDRELRRQHVRRQLRRGVHPQLQHPVRPPRRRARRREDGRRRRQVRAQRSACPFDLPRPAASHFGTVDDFVDNLPLLAIRGFGQNEDALTPLQMALVAATVANGGG